MDLSTVQKGMELQSGYVTEYGNHMYKVKESFEETDIKRNNNLLNSLKTETNANHDHDPSSLFQVKRINEKNFEVGNSLFSYSSFKKAMDLRTHNRTLDGSKRTIFDDAEYFAKNCCYKLLPITFEQVDEMIIQSEHNYSLFSLNSESETEENFSRTMDYSQVKEKNYKRRRTKFRERNDKEELVDSEDFGSGGVTQIDTSRILCEQKESCATEPVPLSFELDNSVAAQPLDLSNAPFVQEEKTDSCLLEHPNSIVENKTCDNDEVTQLDSDKENLNSELNGIRVTITRPDEKENYQPCDLFLNDIARLVPWLIDKDCLEIDILDRTCDHQDEFRKHRLYYVISESTWGLFQRTKERIILTNDSSLGQPLRKAEKDEKPSYVIFDQFSLAKCLAEHCQEIGGCFEYTCVEEPKDEEHLREMKVKEISNIRQELEVENVTEGMGEVQKIDELIEKDPKEVQAIEDLEKTFENVKEQIKEEKIDEVRGKALQDEMKHSEERTTAARKVKVLFSKPKEKVSNVKDKKKTVAAVKKIKKKQGETEKQFTTKITAVIENTKYNLSKKPSKADKNKQKAVAQPTQKIVQSKPTSELETSQKSDKPVNRKKIKKRKALKSSELEPLSKFSKLIDSGESLRKTRSGKVLELDKASQPVRRKKKESEELKKRGKREKEVERVTEGKVKEAGRTLRSQKRDGGEEKGRKKKEKGINRKRMADKGSSMKM